MSLPDCRLLSQYFLVTGHSLGHKSINLVLEPPESEMRWVSARSPGSLDCDMKPKVTVRDSVEATVARFPLKNSQE
jgi:hypothetical protein